METQHFQFINFLMYDSNIDSVKQMFGYFLQLYNYVTVPMNR